MNWENINISHERLNGLKLKAAQLMPKSTPPKIMDHILEKDGIEALTDEQLVKKLRELEVTAK